MYSLLPSILDTVPRSYRPYSIPFLAATVHIGYRSSIRNLRTRRVVGIGTHLSRSLPSSAPYIFRIRFGLNFYHRDYYILYFMYISILCIYIYIYPSTIRQIMRSQHPAPPTSILLASNTEPEDGLYIGRNM